MAVRDVAVGQDGTVIISTESGSVWTRIRRAKPKLSQSQGTKEYKFARVGSLTRIVAVRANNSGSYAAIRNDVELRPIEIAPSSLGRDLLGTTQLAEAVGELQADVVDLVSEGEDDLGELGSIIQLLDRSQMSRRNCMLLEGRLRFRNKFRRWIGSRVRIISWSYLPRQRLAILLLL
jgi:hypothetical protein